MTLALEIAAQYSPHFLQRRAAVAGQKKSDSGAICKGGLLIFNAQCPTRMVAIVLLIATGTSLAADGLPISPKLAGCAASVVLERCPEAMTNPRVKGDTTDWELASQRALLDQARDSLKAKIEYEATHPGATIVWGIQEPLERRPPIDTFGAAVQKSVKRDCMSAYIGEGANLRFSLSGFLIDAISGKSCNW